jgi:LDH2 family malate/lactate/ureidoglycolate dehydrogenase
MPPERVPVPAPQLEQLVTDIYVAHGMREADAGILARVLVWANLRGIDSHGVSRALRYVELCEKGDAKAQPEISVQRPRPSVLIVEADRAPGPVAMNRAMLEAIDTAREAGVAWASVRATTLTGALGYYTSLAADAGMIGIGIVAGMPNMAYEGARGAAVATSPLSVAVPARSEPTVLLDMATAVIALGKITQFRNQGKELPPAVAVTKDGTPTTDPELASVPLPLGGAKGSGMSLVFELLTSVLAGNAIVSAFHGDQPDGKRHRQNAAVLALDVAAFIDLDEFRQAVDETLETIKALPRLVDDEEIRFPGERGARSEAERRAKGIPLPKKLWESLLAEADRLGIQAPDLEPAA